MPFFSFLRSKVFMKQLLIAIGVFFIGYLILTLYLRVYTSHGDSISVPDLTGMTKDEMEHQLGTKALNYLITDTVYAPGKKMGVVLSQNPQPNSLVKEGRCIYIKLSSSSLPKIEMPKITDLSSRQAKSKLLSHGLKIGKIRYDPEEPYDLVVGQRYQGKPIAPGTPIKKESKIDIVVGKKVG